MNVRYERCGGAELFTTDGKTILDCLSGYCVHNLGHNQPDIIATIKNELDHMGPRCCKAVPEGADELATRLCQWAGCEKAFFRSSGSEGVESAIKFERVSRAEQACSTSGAVLMIDPRYGNDSPENGPDLGRVTYDVDGADDEDCCWKNT
jgi:4-aminobutyrate aminotransferase-like enzyme